jgi:hypothetical protein
MTGATPDTIRKQARFAGLLYLAMTLTAPIGLMFVPDTLIVSGNATLTAEHLRTSETLFRIGIASELFHQALAVFIVLALFRLFRPVSEALAWQMVILGALVSVPIMFVNVLNEIAALILVSSAAFLTVFDRAQLDALALLFLRLHDHGIDIASIFWGLWLFPFGLLVIRSGFIPRILGVLLMIAGVAYLGESFLLVLAPKLGHVAGRYAIFLELCELPIVFWLLIWGARVRTAAAPAPAPTS